MAKTDFNLNILVDFRFRAASGIAVILRTSYIGPDIAKIRNMPRIFERIILSGSAQNSVPAEGFSFTGNLCGGRSAGQSGEPSGRLMVHQRSPP